MKNDNVSPSTERNFGEDYEFDLMELLRLLIERWKIVAMTCFLCIAGTLLYLVLEQPVYEAQLSLCSPEEISLLKFNRIFLTPHFDTTPASKPIDTISANKLVDTTPAGKPVLFDTIINNLKSSRLYQEYIKKNNELASSMPNKIPLGMPVIAKGNDTGCVFASIQGHHNSKHLVDWLNGYVAMVKERTISDFFKSVEYAIKSKIEAIEAELQVDREFAARLRQDRIALLEDQLAIATAANIYDRRVDGYAVVENHLARPALDTLEGPLYMRGVKELLAEKTHLENRRSDEPYIVGLREKQQKIAHLAVELEKLTMANADIIAVFDQPTVVSEGPVKHKHKRLLLLGVVVGLLLGVLAAFADKFIQNFRKSRNSS